MICQCFVNMIITKKFPKPLNVLKDKEENVLLIKLLYHQAHSEESWIKSLLTQSPFYTGKIYSSNHSHKYAEAPMLR